MDKLLCMVLLAILIVNIASHPFHSRTDYKNNVEFKDLSAELQNDQPNPFANKERKTQTYKQTNKNMEKNMKSRNVSMVGMPFSVLYMNQQRIKSSKNGHKIIGTDSTVTPLPRIIKSTQRKKYSNFPQLWVSYGWRPSAGK